MSEEIAVLGAGSWGIAIANLLCRSKHDVSLWEFDPHEFEILRAQRRHEKKLPGVTIDSAIKITNNLESAISDSAYIVFAVPAQTLSRVCDRLKSLPVEGKCYVNLAKGIETGTLYRMSQVIRSKLAVSDADYVATLSGPSHAEEVARDIPTSVVVASENAAFAERVQEVFSHHLFRVYRSTDLIGVELGGALKNVIAIASGIIQGLGFGDNTLGALMTRGLAEITRVGIKLGADPLTFSGLSGLGDLITTCISEHSRNRHVGWRIGKGEKLNGILESMVMVAEGVETCRSALELSHRHDVEMPIAREVHKVLFEDKSPADAVSDLMGRSLKEEIWS